ncbi:TssQ family T6SS-associated lipoprotein [Achromobacter ruhlandii]|nr:TssQ family T6SS-associated lipoprotein [Achromobacter ruhlandii]MCZ8432014.1 TssQ family T6SS-associated lipoprotein [Achromobacter ruhlandii]MDC6088916.1 TssQ family T6SS-associated lipoprotein [Achromobacter ruhlandii]MDC6151132.1 TssQ family T6SS-associated lipoprotein [Achromobacter ruhlandii]MDD7982664.1 TssQ family T6SS-associated lipoprotein [Achromobacter ruhlandii]MEB6663013.1 TssQ family T6SS-associated lipoprotein [Achromobacter ruhlandii]
MKIRLLCSSLGLSMVLAGCAGLPASAPEHPPTPEALEQLQRVRDQYSAGQYGEVIRGVARSDELAASSKAVRIEAYKLQAFSYCVSRYTQLCEDSFSRILQIDPNFELAPNEAGHPVWGPVFQRAKSQAAK